MRIHRLAAFTLAFLVACGGQEPAPADSTSETSEGLLRSVPQDAPGGQRQIPADAQNAPSRTIEVDVSLLGYDHGDSLAPVQIVEMSDYGCGYCRKFHQETWPVIRENFIATGKVHWKFLPFITGMFNNSLAATEGAECALAQGSEPFQELNARLWDDQQAWKGASDPQAAVRTMAEEAGVALEAWDACMADDERLERIRAATSLSRDLGVRGTPTFFVMGYPPLQGALPTETFTQLLDMMHSEAVAEDEAGGAEGGAGSGGAGNRNDGDGPDGPS